MRACGEKPPQFTEDTSRIWTKAIWDRIPWTSIVDGERDGHVWFDDFTMQPKVGTTVVHYPYGGYADTGTTIQQGASNEYGELEIILDATDEDEGWIAGGGNTGGSYEFIKQATAAPHIVAFEARFKKDVITTGSVFCGMGVPGIAASGGMVDTTGEMVDSSFIGFHVIETSTLIFKFNVNSQTMQSHIASLDTLVADTYVKVGFLYDPKGPNAKQISVWLNGQLQSTYVTKAQFDAATFPSDTEMNLLFGIKAPTAVAGTATMDWWKAAMVPTS